VELDAGTATMRDDRSLEYRVEGDPTGLPLVFHHGTPGAGVPWPMVSEACRERGVALVLYTRAGYGTSTRRAGRTVADVAQDVADLLDHLGQDAFITLGWSGGGPHSLACAHGLTGRCLAAATGAGVAPFRTDDELHFLEGMGPENHREFNAALAGLDELVPYLEKEAEELLATTPEEIADALGGLVSEVDKAYATGAAAERMHAAFTHGLSNGIWGWADDDTAFTRDWGFGLDELGTVPVSVWQGRQDLMVPFAHGIYLADHIPGARPHLYDDEGHLSLNGRIGDIVDDLLERAGR
jgi:pimeloyl-ACP methyl ester carboxylesterase